MIGLGAIVGIGGKIAGGLMSIFNNRKRERAAKRERDRQIAYNQAKANENPLARSENQHLLGQYDREAEQQIENARNVAAIKGATPEYGVAVQKSVAEGRANLMGQMAAGASERADHYNDMAEQARHDYSVGRQQRLAERQQSFANLAANATRAAGAIIDASMPKAPKAPAAPSDTAPDPVVAQNKAKAKMATMQASKAYNDYVETGVPPTDASQGTLDAYNTKRDMERKKLTFGAIQKSLTRYNDLRNRYNDLRNR